MLNTLGSAVPGRERIVSAEEVYELRFAHPDWVQMQTRQSGLEGTGEIKLRHLVKEALRMRPSRIVVGEVRAEECLDLLLGAQQRPAGDGHGARQLRTRGSRQAVHPAPAGGREHLGAVRRADRRREHRHRRTGRSRWRREAAGTGDRRGPGPGRVGHHRGRGDLHQRGLAGWCERRGCRRGWTASPHAASTSTPCSLSVATTHVASVGGSCLERRRETDVGAALGLFFGTGLLLIWRSLTGPAPREKRSSVPNAEDGGAAPPSRHRERDGRRPGLPLRDLGADRDRG